MDPGQLQQLVDMGFNPLKAAEALAESNDIATAVELLAEMSIEESMGPSHDDEGFSKKSAAPKGGKQQQQQQAAKQQAAAKQQQQQQQQQAAKQAAQQQQQQQQQQQAAAQQQQQGKNGGRAAKVKEHRAGDWTCPNPACGDLVFGSVRPTPEPLLHPPLCGRAQHEHARTRDAAGRALARGAGSAARPLLDARAAAAGQGGGGGGGGGGVCACVRGRGRAAAYAPRPPLLPQHTHPSASELAARGAVCGGARAWHTGRSPASAGT